MLSHGLDDLLLPDWILGGICQERDKCSPLARLLNADRKLDVEGVGQVVDDHPEDAGLQASQCRSAPMIDVAEVSHCRGHPFAG
jgi:hypothetical protein